MLGRSERAGPPYLEKPYCGPMGPSLKTNLAGHGRWHWVADLLSILRHRAPADRRARGRECLAQRDRCRTGGGDFRAALAVAGYASL